MARMSKVTSSRSMNPGAKAISAQFKAAFQRLRARGKAAARSSGT